MKIAFVHNTFPAGGAERITLDIARYLASQGGYEVFVYASRKSDDLWNDGIDAVLTLRMIPSPAVPSKRAAFVEELIVKDQIDVLVQVSKSLPDIDGIRKRTGCKTVLACHGEPFWQRYAIMARRQKGMFSKLMWHVYNKRRFADGTLAMNMAKERSWADYLNNDAYTVLCEAYKHETASVFGIDPDDSHIYAIENPEAAVQDISLEKEKMILFCGRMENWSKRIDRLLRIWSRVQGRMTDWRLVLVGDGPDGKMLRRMASDMNLERVSFEGRRSDVASYYRRASAVCLTSETEGWPLALTEAQAQGCICVAFSATSGIEDILGSDGRCGYLVPPFDEAAYADVLLQIASLPEDEEKDMRKASISRRLRYTPEIIAGKWKELFDRLAK
jgi:glycosyltransferase involved in cell wall biosynthesis